MEHDLSFLAEVHRVGAQNCVPIVRFNMKFHAAAYLHSLEQMRVGYLGHEGGDRTGARLGQRIELIRYLGHTYVEVVAKDFPEARSVIAACMDRPRHREVLRNPDFADPDIARVDRSSNRTNR